MNFTTALSRWVQGLLVITLALFVSGCAMRGDQKVSPEGTAALRANQVVQALRTTVTPEGASPIEQLVASKVISPEDGVKVATAIRQAFVYAGDLAAVLKIADDAQTDAERHSGYVKAAVLVQSIARGLEEATLSVGTQEGRQAVANALRTASNLLLLVGSIFPSPSLVGA